MAKFAELLPWLRTLFPPSEARGFQPSEVSEDISLVHQVHLGTDFLDKALSHNLTSAAGVAFIETPEVASGFYWYVLVCSAFHDDTTARDMLISIAGTTQWALKPEQAGLSVNRVDAIGRSFIVPTFQKLRAEVPAITAGKKVTLRVLYFRITLGLPAIPSP